MLCQTFQRIGIDAFCEPIDYFLLIMMSLAFLLCVSLIISIVIILSGNSNEVLIKVHRNNGEELNIHCENYDVCELNNGTLHCEWENCGIVIVENAETGEQLEEWDSDDDLVTYMLSEVTSIEII